MELKRKGRQKAGECIKLKNTLPFHPDQNPVSNKTNFHVKLEFMKTPKTDLVFFFLP